MRYAYIKNGNVVDQLKFIVSSDEDILSGPNAFLYDFLKVNALPNNGVLLMSRHANAGVYCHENVRSEVVAADEGSIISKVISKFYSFFSVFFRLLSYRPDKILCGTTGGMLWACYIVSKVYSVPFVYSSHNRKIFSSAPWYKKIIMKIDNWCISKATAAVCHGPYLYQQLVDVGVSCNKLFEFDVSFGNMDILAEEEVTPLLEKVRCNRTITYLGRMEEEKGVYELLEACSDRLHNESNLLLVYLGDGRALNDIKSKVASEGLTDKVLVCGKVDHHEIVPIIRNSWVLVAPTRRSFPEGRCMAAMEGLVMGIPVIAPDFGPFPYLIEHEVNGLLFKADSVSDLRKNINRVFDDVMFYQKLKVGSAKSGEKLMSPPRSFAQAVDMGFLA